jgi:patatin-like phospholipase/acyl hydrolase
MDLPSVRVLSIDGGGIRGIIPARVLVAIEELANRRISELFDLIVGTSTGGIIALGLAKPQTKTRPQYKAADLLDLYTKEGHRIFSRSIRHRVAALGNLNGPKFTAGGLEKVLKEYFEDAMLGQALTEVIVTAYEIEGRKPWFFKSRKAGLKQEFDYPMKDVARATSAAPTYFEPARIKTRDPAGRWTLVDGGVFANNPAMCGVAEALKHGNGAKVKVLSLGTGSLARPLPYDDAKDWGLASWARPILNVVFDGVSDTIDYQVDEMCSATAQVSEYLRLQTTLDIAKDDLDNASDNNVHQLLLLGDRIINEKEKEINAFVAAL